MVRLEQLGKRYGDGPEILKGVSLSLAPGSFNFITGASGAGKTTLLSIIALAERPSRGAITLFDTDTEGASRAVRARLRRRIGVVFQDCRLAAELSVAENVGLPLQIDGTPEAAQQGHIDELLEWLGLADKGGERPIVLSAAERQRVALARALVRRPDLLLADEPIGEGGDAAALLLVDTFQRMTQLGTTVVVATHAAGFAERFAHPRLHLEGGTLSPDGEAS